MDYSNNIYTFASSTFCCGARDGVSACSNRQFRPLARENPACRLFSLFYIPIIYFSCILIYMQICQRFCFGLIFIYSSYELFYPIINMISMIFTLITVLMLNRSQPKIELLRVDRLLVKPELLDTLTQAIIWNYHLVDLGRIQLKYDRVSSNWIQMRAPCFCTLWNRWITQPIDWTTIKKWYNLDDIPVV